MPPPNSSPHKCSRAPSRLFTVLVVQSLLQANEVQGLPVRTSPALAEKHGSVVLVQSGARATLHRQKLLEPDDLRTSSQGGDGSLELSVVSESDTEGDWPAVSQTARMVQKLVEAPIQVAKKGGSVLAKKAKIYLVGVGNAAMRGAQAYQEEGLQGAIKAAHSAAMESQAQADQLDASLSASERSSIGMPTVFLVVLFGWGCDFVLTWSQSKDGSEQADPRRDLSTLTRSGNSFGSFNSMPSSTASGDLKEVEADAPQLRALSFARFLAACHVVMHHFYGLGSDPVALASDPWVDFAQWGALAGPFFFCLSGFVNTYAKLAGPSAGVYEDFFEAMIRKVCTWYPLYLTALTWCAIQLWSTSAEDWAHYLSDVLLIEGFIWEQASYPYMLGDWWVCYEMVYLLTWYPLYSALYGSHGSFAWTIFTTCTMIVIPSSIMEWYFFGNMALFRMVQYWPSFAFGMALASWFVKNCLKQQVPAASRVAAGERPHYVMRPVHELPLLVRFGVTVGIVVLGIVIFSISLQEEVPLFRKPWQPLMLKGLMLPVIGIIIMGLSCEVDPLAKLAVRRPFCWGAKLALPMFVLQVPMHMLLEKLIGLSGMTWMYFGTLLLSSFVVHFAVERPWRQFLGVREK